MSIICILILFLFEKILTNIKLSGYNKPPKISASLVFSKLSYGNMSLYKERGCGRKIAYEGHTVLED
jgi:hypothetical protein